MMSLALLADVLKAPLIGRDARFTGVSTDTRTLAPGDLFVALAGPRFDGHSFLPEAIAKGAAGALLSRPLETPLPHVRVPDTRRALGQLAAFWRRQFTLPVAAVTGSNGKTTVKEMVGSILAETGPGCVTRGNLNNDIGVPLTLLRLRAADRYAVIEMGMNHPGEIDYLSRLAAPTVAVITNVAEAHLAGFDGVEGIARAKGEIFAGLAADGVAVLNADDPFYELWRRLAAPRRCVTFGLERPADFRADYRLDERGSALRMKTPAGEIDVRIALLGKHNVMNALAAAAVALSAGAGLDQVAAGLAKLRAVAGRLEVKPGFSGARVIDDTYNANPGSLAAGLEVLKSVPGERVLVLGDMAELGEAGPDIHVHAGKLARDLGVHRLYALGELSALAVASFGEGGRHFRTPAALIDALVERMHAGMVVLVKGSRVMQMDRIVAGIVRRTEPEAPGAAAPARATDR
ncbi:MAG TPA: UDP-N-acetylmuramoyl-tripeptide--D-alanyl-D-alanine ligase [Burkholderiales bacterium]